MNSAIKISLLALFIVVSGLVYADPHAPEQKTGVNANPLTALIEGNNRFVSGHALHPHQDKKTLEINSAGQRPFAVIISCSDSRVPPETIFDQGIGDLFVIRTAGNIISDIEMGSIEYAVEHLGVKLIAVLGHTDCGAIKAYTSGAEARGHIADIVKHIAAEDEVRMVPDPKKDHLSECISANIFHAVLQIRTDEMISGLMNEHKDIQALPMLYDVASGRVQILTHKQ